MRSMKKIICFLGLIISYCLFISCVSSPKEEIASEANLTNPEKSFVTSVIKNTYGGYSDMKKEGFNIKMVDKCKSAEDVFKLFDKYVHDYHFTCKIYNAVWKFIPQTDENCIRSKDEQNTYFEKTTSNAYYIRFSSCLIDDSYPYAAEFVKSANKAAEYDYIILDARSNNGGGNLQQYQFFDSLKNMNYSGTVIVLQDKYSFSSGEVWGAAGFYTSELNIKLIGTYSGGMQSYGNCVERKASGCWAWVPTTKMKLPNDGKWKGEGIGYEPDIFSYTENMKETLERIGIDCTGIEFR